MSMKYTLYLPISGKNIVRWKIYNFFLCFFHVSDLYNWFDIYIHGPRCVRRGFQLNISDMFFCVCNCIPRCYLSILTFNLFNTPMFSNFFFFIVHFICLFMCNARIYVMLKCSYKYWLPNTSRKLSVTVKIIKILFMFMFYSDKCCINHAKERNSHYTRIMSDDWINNLNRNLQNICNIPLVCLGKKKFNSRWFFKQRTSFFHHTRVDW